MPSWWALCDNTRIITKKEGSKTLLVMLPFCFPSLHLLSMYIVTIRYLRRCFESPCRPGRRHTTAIFFFRGGSYSLEIMTKISFYSIFVISIYAFLVSSLCLLGGYFMPIPKSPQKEGSKALLVLLPSFYQYFIYFHATLLQPGF